MKRFRYQPFKEQRLPNLDNRMFRN